MLLFRNLFAAVFHKFVSLNTSDLPYKELNDEELKVYYPIGEVASMLNVNVSLIRYWEKEFDFLQAIRNKKGNRFFTKKDVETLKRIYFLVKEQGLTLEGARKSIEHSMHGDEKKREMLQRLEKVLHELKVMRQGLDKK